MLKSESGDDGRLWKEIADSVYKDSDRLFKMIGEAYAVLSNPEKVCFCLRIIGVAYAVHL